MQAGGEGCGAGCRARLARRRPLRTLRCLHRMNALKDRLDECARAMQLYEWSVTRGAGGTRRPSCSHRSTRAGPGSSARTKGMARAAIMPWGARAAARRSDRMRACWPRRHCLSVCDAVLDRWRSQIHVALHVAEESRGASEVQHLNPRVRPGTRKERPGHVAVVLAAAQAVRLPMRPVNGASDNTRGAHVVVGGDGVRQKAAVVEVDLP